MSATWKLTENRRKIGFSLVVCSLLLLLAGCPNADTRRQGPTQGTLTEGIELELLVVDDPALAATIEQVEGEWNALTRSSFRVEQISQQELETAPALEADAVLGDSDEWLVSLIESKVDQLRGGK